MVKIGRQQGAGGPMPGPEQYKDGIMGSIPLEKPEEPLPPMPPGVKSVADLPFEEQPPMAGDPKQTGTPLPGYTAGAIAPGMKEARAAVTPGWVPATEDHHGFYAPESPNIGDIREDGAVWVGHGWAKIEDPLAKAKELLAQAIAELDKLK